MKKITRVFLTCTTLTTPAQAWEFMPGIPCLLTHETAGAEIELTYDPTGPLYTVTVTRAERWPDAPVFSMRFDGANPISIGTSRHERTYGGLALSVTDTGFGNVLDGLQFNQTAHAIAGDVTVSFPLAGASEPVQAFRTCTADVPVS